jgi:hypothetical protein
MFAGWMVIAGAATLLGGCARTSAATHTSTTATRGRTSVPSKTTVPFNAATNARSDVATVGTCHKESSGLWAWNGTVKNSSTARHTYTIIVDFTDSVDTVEQTKIVTVSSLQPGKVAAWSVRGARGTTNTTCVIRSARIT